MSVRAITGDLARERRLVETEGAHAFLSDTRIAWRTVEVGGRRARVKEWRSDGGVRSVALYMLVGDRIALELSLDRSTATDELETLAESLDLVAFEAFGESLDSKADSLP